MPTIRLLRTNNQDFLAEEVEVSVRFEEGNLVPLADSWLEVCGVHILRGYIYPSWRPLER